MKSLFTIICLFSTAIRAEDPFISSIRGKVQYLFEYNHHYHQRTCLLEPLECVNSDFQRGRWTEGEKMNARMVEVNTMMENWREKINQEHKNTSNKILILGNSGSGVTTFAKFLAEDHGNLKSEEAGISTEEYLILDTNITGQSRIGSTTRYPQEVILSENTSMIDIPGFSEQRSTEEEIFVSYNAATFLKNLKSNFDYQYTKAVILIEYFSVQHGIYKESFINLLHNIYKNFEVSQFSNFILIVTKVPNKYNMINSSRKLISDKNIIINIVDFINKEKLHLNEKLKEYSCKENSFFSFAISLIDDLLETDDDGNYRKINIFRQPDREGALLDIEILQENKISLINTIVSNAVTAERYSVIAKRSSLRFEKYKSCIENIVNTCIQMSYKKMKEFIPEYNVAYSYEMNSYTNNHYQLLHYINRTHNRIMDLNNQIQKMYQLKYHFKNLHMDE